MNLENTMIKDYKSNLIEFYLQYDTILSRLEKQDDNNNNELDQYSRDKLLLFNKKIERFTEELKELDLELRLQKSFNDNKKKQEIQQELEDLNLYYTIMSKLSPFTFGLTEYYTRNKQGLEYKECQLCQKVFKGKEYLERYQQHLKDKHKH